MPRNAVCLLLYAGCLPYQQSASASCRSATAAIGPAAMLTVLPHGSMAMGKQFVQWILYCLVISLLVGYVAAATLPAGTSYLNVFQVTATTAWLGYAGSAAMGAIWFGHGWGRTVKEIVDGLVYGLLTAGFFGWLWP